MAGLPMGGANPFTIPGDEQVFVLREQEKWQKEEERRKAQHRSVKDKLTWSSRIGSAREGVATHSLGSSAVKTWTAGVAASQREGTQGAGETVVAKEKENMNEFIAKKREMGLIRMSMATKLHEIRKLEEEAERAEKRVKQQEEQLEETVQKFEDFLKDNDMRAVEAMKKAELETKGKQEKTAEIKKLSAQIAAIQNEKMKYEEQMQACIRYKKFLDKLTPAGWFRETLCNIELQRLRQELERDLERKFAIREAAEDADTAQLAVDKAAAQAELEAQIEETRGTLMSRLEDQPDEAVAAELNVMDPDIVSMFFVDPEKILNIFMEIEENNLFLIQNCQETEEGLEELKSKFAETKTKMDEDAANLKSQIEQVRQKMGVEETKKKQLLTRMASTKDGRSQEELLNHIHSKVTEIFKASGFGDNEANINTLGMLTKIETKLEELRTSISSLPTTFVWDHMKARDKDRRQRARQHLLEKERIKREKRSATALARSQAPVKKMVGKPVMWRSRPIDRKQAEVVSEDNENEFDDSEFFQ